MDTAIEHMEQMIQLKRDRIASGARSMAREMERLAKSIETGQAVSDCPIQHAATVLNTYCGELSAMIDALGMMKAAK